MDLITNTIKWLILQTGQNHRTEAVRHLCLMRNSFIYIYHTLHINVLSTDTVLDQTLDESILVEMSRFLVRLNYDGIQHVRLILEQFSSRL
jgi:hypothetical protein